MNHNIPNALTLLRILLIPIFVIMSYLQTDSSNFIAACIFFIAAVTDYFDGYLARKYQQITPLGTFLDPVADKIIITTALLIIVEHNPRFFITIPAIIIISREIMISALREWMSSLGEQSKVAVSWLGKTKTAAQLASVTLLIWNYNDYMHYSAIVLLYFAVILTIWSMCQYLIIAKDSILSK